MSAVLRTLAVCAAWLVGACVGPSARITTRQTFERTPSVSVDSIMAPVRGDGLTELATLQRLPPTPANELRRAFILDEGGDTNGAMAALNRLLYSEEPPTLAVEALARFLRSRTSQKRGDAADADSDLQRAREIAQDPRLVALLGTAPVTPPPVAVAQPAATPPTNAPLAVLPRSAWHARPPRQSDVIPLGKPFRITIHHSAVLTNGRSEKTAAAQIYQIQTDHQQSEGWADIAYHYLIDRAGRVWEGRSLRWQGAHAGGDHNRGNIGVCVLGRFLRGGDGQEPTPEQVTALERLLRDLCGRHEIDSGSIFFHRRFKATECPGPRLEAAVNGIRRRMAQSAQS